MGQDPTTDSVNGGLVSERDANPASQETERGPQLTSNLELGLPIGCHFVPLGLRTYHRAVAHSGTRRPQELGVLTKQAALHAVPRVCGYRSAVRDKL